MKKYFNKIISLFLSILLVASLFSGITVTATNQQAAYYVAPNGTGTGRSEADAASSITVALQSIIDDGYGANDEVTIYVKGGEGATSMPSDGLAKNYVNSWPKVGGKDATTEATVTITSMPDAEAPATLDYGSSLHFVVLANTIFKNITLHATTSGKEHIYTNGYNVTFEEDVTFKKGTTFVDNDLNIYTGSYDGFGVRCDNAGTVTINNTSNNKKYSVFFGGSATDSKSRYMAGTKTVVINGGKVGGVYLGGGTGDKVYDSDLNVVLNGAVLSSISPNAKSLVLNGAIQIVANNSSTLPSMASIESYVAEKNIPLYVINSSASNDGFVVTTETVGSYSIDSERTYAYAYDSVNQPDIIYYATDVLRLEKAGTYTVGYVDNLIDATLGLSGDWNVNNDGTITKGPRKGFYYVAPNGTGTGRSEEDAAAGITVALQSIINDGYGANDEVTIYVKGGEGATSMPSDGLAKNYASDWPKVGGKDATTEATITITSMPDAEAPATLDYGSSLHFVVLANTIFKNITLHATTSGKEHIYTNGYNVTFEEDVTFKKGTTFVDNDLNIYTGSYDGFGVRCDNAGTVTINNTSNNKKYSVFFGGSATDSKSRYMAGTKTVVINGGKVGGVYLGGGTGDKVYDSDLNVVLNGAVLSSISPNAKSLVLNGAIQIVANNSSTLPSMASIESYVAEKNIPLYVINSSASNDGFVVTTETVGSYSIDSERTYAYAYDSVNQPDIIYYATDVLRLEKAGTYTVGYVDNLIDATLGLSGNWNVNNDGTITKGPRKGFYYVAPNGTGTGRSEEDAAAGITVALQSIINDGYGAKDEVTIYVKGGEGATSMPSDGLAKNYASDWPKVGGKDATTEATITITSMPDAEAPATLDYGSSLHFVVLANTIFKNITLHATTSGKEHIYTNGYNVTFEEDVTFKKGTTFVDNDLNIYTGSYDGFGVRCDNAGTVTINNTSNNKKYSVFFGGSATDSKSRYMAGTKTVVINGGKVGGVYLGGGTGDKVYDSDLNVVLNGAVLSSISPNAKSLVINGAIQIIANNSSTLPSMASIKSYVAEKNIPFYVMDAETNYIMPTETVGTYEFESGNLATAVDSNNSAIKYTSKDGIISVAPGEYKVQIKVYVLGDVTGDSVVNAEDLVALRKILFASNMEYKAENDINDDGEVDIIDLIKLKNLLAE